MDIIITISDVWDRIPLSGLTTFKEEFCVFERIFSEANDDWTNDFYLTPISSSDAEKIKAEWNRWCEFMLEDYSSERAIQYKKEDVDETEIAKESPYNHKYLVQAKFHFNQLQNYADKDMDVKVEWLEDQKKRYTRL